MYKNSTIFHVDLAAIEERVMAHYVGQKFVSDYYLWKTWWYMALYGASPEHRMEILDRLRNSRPVL